MVVKVALEIQWREASSSHDWAAARISGAVVELGGLQRLSDRSEDAFIIVAAEYRRAVPFSISDQRLESLEGIHRP